METKYDFEFKAEDVKRNIQRLTNQLWKLIPMRENKEDWERHLKGLTLEIAGMNEVFMKPIFLQQLLSKMEGLRVEETTFELYRKTVFECISLLQELNRGIK